MVDLPDTARTEIAIIEMTNAFRHEQKLGNVKRNKELDLAARLFAEYLAKTGKFAHEADGRQPADRAKAAGYKYCMIAENLASHLDSRGFKTAGLAGAAVEGWKNSPGHRKNMLQPHVTEIGVGVAKAPDRDPKFLSVQLFGRPEALKYQFRIENKAGQSITYSAFGKSHTLEPRVTVTHSACDPGEVIFEQAGGWLTAKKLVARFEARDGAVFVVKADAGKGVLVEMSPAGKNQPSWR